VDTTGVAATAHVNAHEAEREDEPRPSLTVSDALANAPNPALEAGLFRVPRVIG
jgi:aspartyl/glutamyl-tRNA(Asn/Gln) amidotransferase C subunit